MNSITAALFHILAPGRDQITGSTRPNDDCLVFTATVGATTALLEGDAERPAERRVVEEHPEAMPLKVAHHGSASGTSADLLTTVHPRYAVISVWGAKCLWTPSARGAGAPATGWSKDLPQRRGGSGELFP